MGTVIIRESELKNFQGLHDLKYLESREDVATLLDLYEQVIEKGYSSNQIIAIKEDSSKNYMFVVGDKERLFSFDIVSFVSSRYTSKRVTTANIRLLFPKRLSRVNENRVARTNKGVLKLFYQKDNLLISIPRDGDVVIGRSAKNADFQITGNEKVSRVHCKVFYNKNTGTTNIADCNSQNGTFVDGHRIDNVGVALSVGETVTVADEKFLVVE